MNILHQGNRQQFQKSSKKKLHKNFALKSSNNLLAKKHKPVAADSKLQENTKNKYITPE